MTARRKSEKGGFWIAVAAFAFLASLALPFVAADIGGRMKELRGEGVVSAAIIEGKEQAKSRATKVQAGGGRLVSRNAIEQTFTLSFDNQAATRHRDYKPGGKLASKGSPVPYPYTITVGPEIYARYDEGDTILVTFLPDAVSYDKDSFQLTEIVNQQSQSGFMAWLYLGALMSLVVGIWAGHRGWKQGKKSE